MVVISFLTSEQISPEDWVATTKMKKFEETATIKEVKEWVIQSGGITKEGKMHQAAINEPE